MAPVSSRRPKRSSSRKRGGSKMRGYFVSAFCGAILMRVIMLISEGNDMLITSIIESSSSYEYINMQQQNAFEKESSDDADNDEEETTTTRLGGSSIERKAMELDEEEEVANPQSIVSDDDNTDEGEEVEEVEEEGNEEQINVEEIANYDEDNRQQEEEEEEEEEEEDFELEGASMTTEESTTAETNDYNTILEEIEEDISVIPSKIFTVVGLESSGTTFVSQTIGKALGLKIIEGDVLEETIAVGKSQAFTDSSTGIGGPQSVEVQHISLPWGLTCTQFQSAHLNELVPVIYPFQCMKYERNFRQRLTNGNATDLLKNVAPNIVTKWNQCESFHDDHGNNNNHDEKSLPKRYFLNVTSHYEWYRKHNVDAHLIIVVRDTSISKAARAIEHCPNSTAVTKEEEIGMKIIDDTMNHYVKHSPAPSTTTTTGEGTVNGDSNSKHFGDGIIGSNTGKIIFISYEMLIRFEFEYLKMIYNYLGIKSNYNPIWENGNAKYVGKRPTKHRKRRGILGKRLDKLGRTRKVGHRDASHSFIRDLSKYKNENGEYDMTKYREDMKQYREESARLFEQRREEHYARLHKYRQERAARLAQKPAGT